MARIVIQSRCGIYCLQMSINRSVVMVGILIFAAPGKSQKIQEFELWKLRKKPGRAPEVPVSLEAKVSKGVHFSAVTIWASPCFLQDAEHHAHWNQA